MSQQLYLTLDMTPGHDLIARLNLTNSEFETKNIKTFQLINADRLSVETLVDKLNSIHDEVREYQHQTQIPLFPQSLDRWKPVSSPSFAFDKRHRLCRVYGTLRLSSRSWDSPLDLVKMTDTDKNWDLVHTQFQYLSLVEAAAAVATLVSDLETLAQP